MSDFIEEFRVELALEGIPITGEILADGAFHHYKTDGDSRPNCWYILFGDGKPAGKYGCFKRQIEKKWKYQNGSGQSTPPDAETVARWEEAKKKRNDEVLRMQSEAAESSTKTWESAVNCLPQHGYLRKKQVQPHRAKLCPLESYAGWVMLDLRDTSGKITTLQFIAEDGTKRFTYGGRKHSSYHSIEPFTGIGPILVCEGFATGASLHDATKYDVACAMDCGNLKPVCVALKKAYPDRQILVCADNDDKTEGNPGITKGSEAAKEVGAKLVYPKFPESMDCPKSDFNDLMVAGGLDEVATQIRLELEREEPKPEPPSDEELPGNEEPHGDSDGVVYKLPEIVDSAVFVAKEIVKPPCLVEGLIHQGTKAIIGGGSKSFKTWALLDAAISIAYGARWMNFQCVQGRVLFVNFEIQPAFFQDRIKVVAKTKGITLEPGRLDVWNLRGYAAPYGLILPRITERIKTIGYSCLILDPVYKMYGSANENDASEVAQLMNAMDKVAVDTGAATLFGAHYSKGNQSQKDSIDRISGSGVFARDPDSIIPFTKHEEEGSFVVEPTLRNLPPIQPFVVTWNFPLFEQDQALDPSKLKTGPGRPKEHSATTILDLLNDGPLTLQNWQENAEKMHGISRATFYRLKTELKQNDLIMFQRSSETWVRLIKK